MDRWTDERLDETVAGLRRDLSRFEGLGDYMRSTASDLSRFRAEVNGRLLAAEQDAREAKLEAADSRKLIFTTLTILLAGVLGLLGIPITLVVAL